MARGLRAFAAFATLVPYLLLAQQPAKAVELVAVLDLESVGATSGQISAASERLREELLQTGQFRLVDRGQIAKIMDEQALQQSGCTTQECAVQVGKILGVRKLVTGRLTKVEDDLWLISCTMVDVESAETLRVTSIQHDGPFRTMLGTSIPKLAVHLTPPQPPARARTPAARPRPISPAPEMTVQSARLESSAAKVSEPRGVRTVALFPMYYVPCASCDNATVERDFARLAGAALRSISGLVVQHSYYPDATRGGSLRNDPDLNQELWTGSFNKQPNTEIAVRKGRQLGVDCVVMIVPRRDPATTTFDLFLVETRRARVFDRRITVSQDENGKAHQADMDREFAIAFDLLRVQP